MLSESKSVDSRETSKEGHREKAVKIEQKQLTSSRTCKPIASGFRTEAQEINKTRRNVKVAGKKEQVSTVRYMYFWNLYGAHIDIIRRSKWCISLRDASKIRFITLEGYKGILDLVYLPQSGLVKILVSYDSKGTLKRVGHVRLYATCSFTTKKFCFNRRIKKKSFDNELIK